jgi:putative inorganic carbon (HCO3(-)) transporter
VRDLLLFAIFFGSVPFILWRPAIGAFVWVWVSIMAPHRMTFGFAYDFAFAQLIAIATLIGVLFSREAKRLPVTPVTVVLFLLLVWINVTTFFALDTSQALPMWERVMKVQFMVFVTLYILNTRQHINVLIWVTALSVGFYSVKGGLFTLRGGGGEGLVWGPPGSFIEDNNSLALATTMTIPVLYYLFLQTSKRWLGSARRRVAQRLFRAGLILARGVPRHRSDAGVPLVEEPHQARHRFRTRPDGTGCDRVHA